MIQLNSSPSRGVVGPMRKHYIAAAILLATVASPGLIASQSQAAGVFVTRIGGNELAREEYRFSGEGQWQVKATLIVRNTRQEVVTRHEADGRWTFLVEAGGNRRLDAMLDTTAGVARLRLPQAAEVETSARFFLENVVWHHFIPILDAHRQVEAAVQEFDVFVPSQQVTLGVSLKRLKSFQVPWQEGTLQLVPYQLQPARGPMLECWTDSFGAPLYFRVADQRLDAVREGYEGLAQLLGDAESLLTAPAEVDNPLVRTIAVQFYNGPLKLSGSLTVPSRGKGPWPGVLFVSGSGSQDRNGKPGSDGVPLRLAEYLSERGFAVLRHDDRGSGSSDFPDNPTSYLDLVADSRSALQAMRERDEIDGRLVVIGHSEGALTAAILGSEETSIAGVVTMAGTSITIDRLVLEQSLYQRALRGVTDPGDDKQMSAVVRGLLRIAEEARKGRRDVALTDVYEYMRQHQSIDARQKTSSIKAPLLVLQGARDQLVMPYHALRLAEAARQAGVEVGLRVFPELGHSFRDAETNQLAESLLETLYSWLAETLPAESGH